MSLGTNPDMIPPKVHRTDQVPPQCKFEILHMSLGTNPDMIPHQVPRTDHIQAHGKLEVQSSLKTRGSFIKIMNIAILSISLIQSFIRTSFSFVGSNLYLSKRRQSYATKQHLLYMFIRALPKKSFMSLSPDPAVEMLTNMATSKDKENSAIFHILLVNTLSEILKCDH